MYVVCSLLLVLSLMLAACGGTEGGTTTQPTAEAVATEGGTETEPTAETEPEATTEGGEEGGAVEGGTAAADWTCPEGDHTVTLWHGWQGEYFTAIEQVFADYQATCPNITVELLEKPDLSNAVTAAVPAGEGPDILAWVNDQIGRNAETGIIAPVTQYIDADEFNSTYVGPAVQAVTYNDEVWAFPESMEALTFIYNKDLISEEELPQNTDELLEMAASWDKSEYLFVYNARNDAYFSAPWWNAAGVTVVDEEGTTNFAENGEAAGEFIRSLTEHMPAEIDYGIADTLFKEGKAAIIMNGPWYIADLEPAGIDYGLATIPTFSPSGEPGKPFVGVKVVMLTTNAEERGTAEAAVNIMQFYTRAEAQVALAEANKMVPTNTEAAADSAVMELSDVAAFSAQADLGTALPNTPFMNAMWDPMAKGVECIWTGTNEVADCITQIQTLAEENIEGMK